MIGGIRFLVDELLNYDEFSSVSVEMKYIPNLSKRNAQGANKREHDEGFLVLIHRTNIFPLRCNLSCLNKFVLVISIELRTFY